MKTAAIELARFFLEDAPADAANKLEALPPAESAVFLNHTSAKITARVFLCLSPVTAASILGEMNRDAASDVLAFFNPNQIASLLRNLPTEKQTGLLKLLPEKRAQGCKKLLQFPDNCVGALALTEVPVFSNNMSVEECLVRIKTQGFLEADPLFINDTENRYLGAKRLSELLRVPGKTRLNTLSCENRFQLSGLTPISTAYNLKIWQQEEVIAVVDAKHYFVGSLSHRNLRRALHSHENQAEPVSPLLAELGGAFASGMLGLIDELKPGVSATGGHLDQH